MASELGSTILCATLKSLHLETIIGVPGTQNIHLFDAFHEAGLDVFVPTSELGGAFMAAAHARVSGNPAVLATIPGPGLMFALPGLAEAKADSAAVVHLIVIEELPAGRSFRLQELPVEAVVGPHVKGFFAIHSASEIAATLGTARHTALTGEPGPVCVTITQSALRERLQRVPLGSAPPSTPTPSWRALIERFMASKRPLLFVGSGASHFADGVHELCHHVHIPLCTTPSARGIVSEESPWVIPADVGCGGAKVVNAAIAAADLVLAIGCKFSHNGTGGFALQIPQSKLVHVDASEGVLNKNYPGSLTVVGDAGECLRALITCQRPPAVWDTGMIATLRRDAELAHLGSIGNVPSIAGRPAPEFFRVLQSELAGAFFLTTDAGFHQQLARALLSFHTPRGLLLPSDFQSMGFGIPSAMGAALHRAAAPVIAVVGDGGFACMGLELTRAVEAELRLTIIVVVDGAYGLIRRHQLTGFGRESCVALPSVDLASFARSIGAGYERFSFDNVSALQLLKAGGVNIIEVPLEESAEFRRAAAGVRAKAALKAALRGDLSGIRQSLRRRE